MLKLFGKILMQCLGYRKLMVLDMVEKNGLSVSMKRLMIVCLLSIIFTNASTA
ncbi:hypothetical protein J2Y56_001040 [Pseudomonas sp. BE134]|nr:hypothetical protein [Pseudomonas sp. BE134]